MECEITSRISPNGETSPASGTSVMRYSYITTFREWSFANLGVICESLDSIDCTWSIGPNMISVETEMNPFNMIDFICGIDSV